MADGTKIEWTDATWNPITGCAIVSPGCTNCYAMKLAGSRLKNHASREGLTRDTKVGPVWTGEVRFNPHLAELGRKPIEGTWQEHAVRCFDAWIGGDIEEMGTPPTTDDVRRDLKGNNLACWCKPGDPCHADVLLFIANDDAESGP